MSKTLGLSKTLGQSSVWGILLVLVRLKVDDASVPVRSTGPPPPPPSNSSAGSCLVLVSVGLGPPPPRTGSALARRLGCSQHCWGLAPVSEAVMRCRECPAPLHHRHPDLSPCGLAVAVGRRSAPCAPQPARLPTARPTCVRVGAEQIDLVLFRPAHAPHRLRAVRPGPTPDRGGLLRRLSSHPHSLSPLRPLPRFVLVSRTPADVVGEGIGAAGRWIGAK